MKNGKLIIFSAPSGSGKSTLANYLREQEPSLGFSISATTRPPRGAEQHGVEYFFFSVDEFREKIQANEFVEYEEVYPGRYYGTLKSQVEEQLKQQSILFDVDVAGACRLKEYYGERALFIFVQAPSLQVLAERLAKRGDTSPEDMQSRLGKAEHEMGFAKFADVVVVNDNLETAKSELLEIVKTFLNNH